MKLNEGINRFEAEIVKTNRTLTIFLICNLDKWCADIECCNDKISPASECIRICEINIVFICCSSNATMKITVIIDCMRCFLFRQICIRSVFKIERRKCNWYGTMRNQLLSTWMALSFQRISNLMQHPLSFSFLCFFLKYLCYFEKAETIQVSTILSHRTYLQMIGVVSLCRSAVGFKGIRYFQRNPLINEL